MTKTIASSSKSARSSRWRALALLLAAIAANGVSAQEADVKPAPHGEGEIAGPLYTPEDLLFLSHMILHHEQALELAALVPSRTKREDFIRFARYLNGAQQAEIDQMKTLLELAADRGLEPPHHEMNGDPPMAGMLSKAQMAAVRAASGAQFERLWLQGMILHHEGALDMARAQQQRQFDSGRRPYGVDVLLDDILVVQRGEITRMKAWLNEWGLSDSAGNGAAFVPLHSNQYFRDDNASRLTRHVLASSMAKSASATIDAVAPSHASGIRKQQWHGAWTQAFSENGVKFVAVS